VWRCEVFADDGDQRSPVAKSQEVLIP